VSLLSVYCCLSCTRKNSSILLDRLHAPNAVVLRNLHVRHFLAKVSKEKVVIYLGSILLCVIY